MMMMKTMLIFLKILLQQQSVLLKHLDTRGIQPSLQGYILSRIIPNYNIRNWTFVFPFFTLCYNLNQKMYSFSHPHQPTFIQLSFNLPLIYSSFLFFIHPVIHPLFYLSILLFIYLLIHSSLYSSFLSFIINLSFNLSCIHLSFYLSFYSSFHHFIHSSFLLLFHISFFIHSSLYLFICPIFNCLFLYFFSSSIWTFHQLFYCSIVNLLIF